MIMMADSFAWLLVKMRLIVIYMWSKGTLLDLIDHRLILHL